MASSSSFHDHERDIKYYPSCPCERCESTQRESERYWTTNNLGYVIERTSSHSTNSTASNLPGPGRTLDRFLGKLGRAVEKPIFCKAHKLGFGPKATAIRLNSRIAKYDQAMDPSDRRKAWKNIIKDCHRLLKYTERCIFFPVLVIFFR